MLEIEKKLILKFLNRNYPVYRLKYKGHFKRTIVLDKGAFVLSDMFQFQRLYTELLEIISTVFKSDKKTIEAALIDFLHLKPNYSNKIGK